MKLKETIKLLSPSYQKVILDYKVTPRPRGMNQTLERMINANREQYKSLLESFLQNKDVLQSIRKSSNGITAHEPTYNNGFLPGLDIVALYSIIALYRPEQYIEIGSGNSTRVAFKSITDQKLQTRITSIDPMPRAEVNSMAHTVICQPLENLSDFSCFENMKANDILFIDNSHRSFPNSDVTVCFLEVLPRLKKGVIIHIHDIYLPYDYPQFMCDRFYNEQYLLACLLLGGNENYETLLPNFFVSEDKELRHILDPVWNHPNLEGVERHGGSYWLLKK